MKKWIIAVSLLLFAAGCADKTAAVETASLKADMSGYENFTETDHHFLASDVQDFLERMDDQETMTAYFGFSECPWCNEALPILNECAEEAGTDIYYINTRPTEDVTNNTEMPDYDLLLARIGSCFSYDNEGNHHLYVPFVVFVKDGEVVMTHEGTVDGHDAHERVMTDEEREEVREIYRSGFAMLKE